VFSRAGYSLLVTDSEGDPALDRAHIEVLQQRRVYGLLLSLSDERHPEIVKTLKALEIPFVLVDRYQPRGLKSPEVHFDHRRGMRAAAEHLWGLGHRRVALIVGGPRRPADERLKGVQEVFAGDGQLSIHAGPYTIEHGTQAAAAALGAADPPTAIIAAANLFMHGALRTLRDRGLVLGRDISFVGCDDVAVAEFHDPPIALVRRNTRQIGEVAARVLLAELGAGPRVPNAELVLPSEFVARPSCGPV
jgi:LacI family transcriptional regulator